MEETAEQTSSTHEAGLREGKVINITRALATPDLRWPYPNELKWLAEQASTHKIIVEIGSYQGRSTVAMAGNTTGVVYAMDDWYGPRDDSSIQESDRVDLFERFLANVDGLPVQAIRCDHKDAGAMLPSAVPPDMVFIDGGHSYWNARRDIEIWKERLQSGGLLCGHDANHKTVREALTSTLAEWKIVSDTTIWEWRKP
jgi:predicted O-methyltransferase YrrM